MSPAEGRPRPPEPPRGQPHPTLMDPVTLAESGRASLLGRFTRQVTPDQLLARRPQRAAPIGPLRPAAATSLRSGAARRSGRRCPAPPVSRQEDRGVGGGGRRARQQPGSAAPTCARFLRQPLALAITAVLTMPGNTQVTSTLVAHAPSSSTASRSLANWCAGHGETRSRGGAADRPCRACRDTPPRWHQHEPSDGASVQRGRSRRASR